MGAALRHFLAAYRAAPATTSGIFVLPVWLQASWWRLLRGSRVPAVNPGLGHDKLWWWFVCLRSIGPSYA